MLPLPDTRRNCEFIPGRVGKHPDNENHRDDRNDALATKLERRAIAADVASNQFQRGEQQRI